MYLRCMSHLEPRRWNTWLSLAEWWYNTIYHTAIQMTLFEALYGTKPPQLALGPYEQAKVATVGDYLKDKKQMDELLQYNLKTAQERMKKYADEHRSEREFQVRDWVYLRLQSYRQSTVMVRNNTKLSAKYFGPYLIEERIGQVAYKLRLPTASRIHHVFHVSLLKKKLGDKATPILQLPNTDERGLIRVEPVTLLGRRMIKRGNAAVTQWLDHGESVVDTGQWQRLANDNGKSKRKKIKG
ncbi:uncharacterized protein LOC113769165 [Coffea eugenioides]|uniref:uncharacterized protein LOC113769165 n=1 Tax=Coffea eugenioides TaxID=49369 RepID=UPI000F604627|nr:uncharacterized protein LOC113769165 [Coffea eugenioides]